MQFAVEFGVLRVGAFQPLNADRVRRRRAAHVGQFQLPKLFEDEKRPIARRNGREDVFVLVTLDSARAQHNRNKQTNKCVMGVFVTLKS